MTNEEYFNKHIGLAYKFSKKYINNKNYEEIKHISLIGLYKAILKFDITLGYSFSTFAYVIMQYDVWNFLREDKKFYANTISIQKYLTDEWTLEDTISDTKDEIKNIEDKIYIQEINKKILEKNNFFINRNKEIYKYILKGYTQIQISKMFNLDASVISRIKNKIEKERIGI